MFHVTAWIDTRWNSKPRSARNARKFCFTRN